MKMIDEMYGEVIAELRRRKYTVEKQHSCAVVGLGGVTLMTFEIDKEDLDKSVEEVCDEVVQNLNEYLDMQKNDDLDRDEERMNSLHSKRIRQHNVLKRSHRLLSGRTGKERG